MESWGFQSTLSSAHACVPGAAPGGNPPEAQPQQQDKAAGRGEEQPARAAGGGRGGQEEPGETDAGLAGPGKLLWVAGLCEEVSQSFGEHIVQLPQVLEQIVE